MEECMKERYGLAKERIREIITEETVKKPFGDFFRNRAKFLSMAADVMDESAAELTMEVLKERNHCFYQDILPENYESSYGNPAYAVQQMGEYGKAFSFLYAEIAGTVAYAHEKRLWDMTVSMELFLEVYSAFCEEELPEAATVEGILRSYVNDYCQDMMEQRIREGVDPELDFAADIIMNSDLSDLRYLYRYGEFVSENETGVAEFLNSLSQEEIDKMASTYTEGYRKGFETMGRDLSKKKTVSIRYQLGFERMIRSAIRQFEEMGLEVILYRAAVWSVTMSPNRRIGYHGTSANMQFDYDHRYDQAIYLDKAFKERKLAVLRTAYENCKKQAAEYAGPAVVETFGEDGFEPLNKPEAYSLSEKQEELQIAYSNEAMPVVNQYIPGDETSFTIIAFPVPAIGRDFAEIFHETIRINTLDYEEYKKIQQNLVDVLDQAEYVTVTGNAAAGNETQMKIFLHTLTDPEKQTNFENCVADVNIPVGEVFTSPVLAGTEGLLHVRQVYIGDFQFKNFRMEFKDGRVTDYSCDNFADSEEGRKLIRQQILKNHDTLPMGEFAIGTNTTAYAVAQKYGIMDKFPILIAEKTGPHFAVGDTCYSWSEDSAVYNPDGKEIIARDNEISLLRKEDVSKAYFGCHTDITIPYSELGDITAVCSDGRKLPLIQSGRFVAAGTEKLNEELDG